MDALDEFDVEDGDAEDARVLLLVRVDQAAEVEHGQHLVQEGEGARAGRAEGREADAAQVNAGQVRAGGRLGREAGLQCGSPPVPLAHQHAHLVLVRRHRQALIQSSQDFHFEI